MTLSNAKIKYLRSLQLKKYRQKYNKFIVEGDKIVGELLAQSSVKVDALFATEAWLEAQGGPGSIAVQECVVVEEQDLKQVSSLSTPNQVLALAEMPTWQPLAEDLDQHFSFYLDGIRDPGNMGTLLRIADWFGLPAVFCSPDSVDLYNPKVLQASMGAFLRVPVWERSIQDLRALLGDFPLLGAVLDGPNLFELSLPRKGLIVIGSEARGISPEVESQLTFRLSIPKASRGGAESLNAAVAGGIICAVLQNRQ